MQIRDWYVEGESAYAQSPVEIEVSFVPQYPHLCVLDVRGGRGRRGRYDSGRSWRYDIRFDKE